MPKIKFIILTELMRMTKTRKALMTKEVLNLRKPLSNFSTTAILLGRL